MKPISLPRHPRLQRGFSLIDIMVGLVIGLIAILVIYQVFATSEAFKRNTTSVGDAQQNGLLSSFMMSVELANAANGLAAAEDDLATCKGSTDIASTWRPIPLLIHAGTAAGESDRFVVTYSTSNGLVAPAPFTQAASANAPTYRVQSPQGFSIGDLVVGISKNAAGDCGASQVTGVSAPDATGVVTITQTTNNVAYTGASVLFNMGKSATAQKARYDVASGVLRSTSLLDPNGNPDNAAVPNPLASNIVYMRLQYGLDTLNAGTIDTWTSATGDWDDAALLALSSTALMTKMKQLRAVRIGVVVTGEQFDQDLSKQDNAAAHFRKWGLFNNVFSGDIPAGVRYKTYEMVVPLRNPIWNK